MRPFPLSLPPLHPLTHYKDATEGLEIMSSVEATVIIIAACLPTLRPVYRALLGHRETTDNSSKKRPRDYQLHSYGTDTSKGSKGFEKSKASKNSKAPDPYRIDAEITNYDAEADSMEDRIMPPAQRSGSTGENGHGHLGGITKTFDVEVNHDGRVSQQADRSFSGGGRHHQHASGVGRPGNATLVDRNVRSQEWDRGAVGDL